MGEGLGGWSNGSEGQLENLKERLAQDLNPNAHKVRLLVHHSVSFLPRTCLSAPIVAQ